MNYGGVVTRGQVILLAGLTVLALLAIDMYLPGLPTLARDLGISVSRAGHSVSVFLLGIAGGQLLAGPLSDRLGRRPVIIAGVALFLAATIAAALATSFDLLLAMRLVQALGACATMVAVRAAVRDRFEQEESARFFSLLALIGGITPVLAPVVGAALLDMGGWRLSFWGMAGVAAALLATGLKGLRETRSDATRKQAIGESPLRAYRSLLGNPRLAGPLLATLANSGAYFAYVANGAIVFIHGYGLSPGQFSLLFALNSIALIGAAQINRQLLRRRTAPALLAVSARNALILCLLLLAFAATEAGGFWTLTLLLFLTVGSVSPVQANAMATGLSVDPLRAGASAALLGAAAFAGGAFASWAAGLLYDGAPRALAVVAALCLAGVWASLRLLPRPGTASVRPDNV